MSQSADEAKIQIRSQDLLNDSDIFVVKSGSTGSEKKAG